MSAHYDRFVKLAFDHCTVPSMVQADIIVPQGGEDDVAFNLIVRHVTRRLLTWDHRLGDTLVSIQHHDLAEEPRTLNLLPSACQIHGLLTFDGERDTPRVELIFYNRRLMCLTSERAHLLLPSRDVKGESPQTVPYPDVRLESKRICGVNVPRAGETMERALRGLQKNVLIVRMRIQRSHDVDESELCCLRLSGASRSAVYS